MTEGYGSRWDAKQERIEAARPASSMVDRHPNYQTRLSETIRSLKAGITRLRYTDAIVAGVFQESEAQRLNYTQTLEMALIVMTEAKDNAQQATLKKLQNSPYPVGLEFPEYVEPRYVRELFSKE